MSPLWLLVVINIVALFVAPCLTYRYAHRNNLKLLKEGWVARVREAAVRLLRASEDLFHTNSDIYANSSVQSAVAQEQRKELDRRRTVAQCDFYAARCQMRLLFKKGHEKWPALEEAIKALQTGVDDPVAYGNGEHLHMESRPRLDAQNRFVEHINDLLHEYWNEVTET